MLPVLFFQLIHQNNLYQSAKDTDGELSSDVHHHHPIELPTSSFYRVVERSRTLLGTPLRQSAPAKSIPDAKWFIVTSFLTGPGPFLDAGRNVSTDGVCDQVMSAKWKLVVLKLSWHFS